jgi:hypothetical protein
MVEALRGRDLAGSTEIIEKEIIEKENAFNNSGLFSNHYLESII